MFFVTHTKNSAQVKADAKVEVDLEAAEELMVTRADFLHALKHDVKPALGSAEDLLQVLTKLFPSTKNPSLRAFCHVE